MAAANIPVAVVPTLAPSMNGNTLRTVSTPAPISGITRLVVTDDDWTMNVSTIPKAIATNGLPNT